MVEQHSRKGEYETGDGRNVIGLTCEQVGRMCTTCTCRMPGTQFKRRDAVSLLTMRKRMLSLGILLVFVLCCYLLPCSAGSGELCAM
jgi:hypothetical protein